MSGSGHANVRSRPEVRRGSRWGAVHSALDRGVNHLPLLLYVAFALVFVWLIAHEAFSTRVITYSPGTDYWEHSATLRALMDRPWSRADPFTGLDTGSARMMPHYLLVALVARGVALNALDAAALAATLNALLFVVAVFVFFRTCFRDSRAPLLGLVVMLCSWWEGWHYSNVYQLWVFFSVGAYPSTAALGFALLTLTAGIATLRRSSPWHWCLLTALLAANTLLTHLLTAMLALSGCWLLCLTEPGIKLSARLRLSGAVAAGVLATHAWPYYSPLHVALGGAGRLSGWLSSSVVTRVAASPSVHTLHEFYKFDDLVRALGLSLPAAILACFMLALGCNRFVGFGALAMAVPFIANAFTPIPLGHRFVLLSMVYLHVALVWGLLMLCPGYARAGLLARNPWLRRAFALTAVVVLNVFIEHNLALAQARLRVAAAATTESPQIRYAREVSKHTQSTDCVLATPLESWPLPTFGTRVVAAFHENPLVPDGQARLEAAERFFRRGVPEAERAAIITRWRVTHVLAGTRPQQDLLGFLSRHGTAVASSSGRTLYRLTQGR